MSSDRDAEAGPGSAGAGTTGPGTPVAAVGTPANLRRRKPTPGSGASVASSGGAVSEDGRPFKGWMDDIESASEPGVASDPDDADGFEGDLGDSDGASDYEDDEDDAIDDVDRPWWSLLADSFRHGLPFVYVIIVLLALAYFIMLLEQQQQRIHRLQSRITNLEQVCTARRKADNLFTASA